MVLHIATARTWRGGEQQMAYLVEELEKQGVEQTVLCTKNSAVETYCRDHGIPFEAIARRTSVSLRFARHIRSLCRHFDVEVIHCHDAHAHTFAVMAATLFGNPTPVVISRRVDFPVSKSRFSRFKYNHHCIRAILCVSDKIREITAPSLRNPSVLHTVYSGIDLDRFANPPSVPVLRKEFGIPDDQRVVANVAALAPHKDYFTFVDTVSELVKSHFPAHYFIIGDGPLRNEVEAYIRQKELGSHITMTGFRKDIPALLPGIDVFLITSKTEGLGTSILDAFACGVPVVATDAGGIPEIVRDGETGLLAPVGNPLELARHVRQMVENDALRKRLVEGATHHLAAFTRSATADATLKIYRSAGLGV